MRSKESGGPPEAVAAPVLRERLGGAPLGLAGMWSSLSICRSRPAQPQMSTLPD
jgi:hypothetical protein